MEHLKDLGALGTVGTTVVIAALVLLAILIFSKPLRFILKLGLNVLCGFVALILLNFVGGAFGLTLGVNWLNAAVVGVLGLPGVALLLVLKWLMLI